MAAPQHIPRRSPIEYDRVRRRVWLFGQRCHHGATGTLLTAAAVGALATSRLSTRGIAALAATGGLLMAHDWHDRSFWFARGR
jgi:hypothetical protein